MIVYDLACAAGHRFEGWFGSSSDFEAQRDGGLLDCPQCGSAEVTKAPMAPSVPAKTNQQPAAPSGPNTASNLPIPAEVRRAMKALVEVQRKALESSRYVGQDFSDNARAMHYGEKEVEAIHGKATLEQAKELLEEGVAVSPLPFPVADPDELN